MKIYVSKCKLLLPLVTLMLGLNVCSYRLEQAEETADTTPPDTDAAGFGTTRKAGNNEENKGKRKP